MGQETTSRNSCVALMDWRVLFSTLHHVLGAFSLPLCVRPGSWKGSQFILFIGQK